MISPRSSTRSRPPIRARSTSRATASPSAIAPAPACFQRLPEERAGKNRLHVDLAGPDHETEVKRVIGLGAEHVADYDEYGHRWTTLRDPEGSVFDIGAA
jgi:hypothetical protein